MDVMKYKAAHIFFQAGQFLINLQFMKLSMLPGVLPGRLCLAGIWGGEKMPHLVHSHGTTLKTHYSTEGKKAHEEEINT